MVVAAAPVVRLGAGGGGDGGDGPEVSGGVEPVVLDPLAGDARLLAGDSGEGRGARAMPHMLRAIDGEDETIAGLG